MLGGSSARHSEPESKSTPRTTADSDAASIVFTADRIARLPIIPPAQSET
jgi:hypothetical protein